ncbi:MAG: alpha/beta fold hydrolase [Fuerstiella sp.]|jgi:pimeloyl-ACP methyl ester carboxylesterase
MSLWMIIAIVGCTIVFCDFWYHQYASKRIQGILESVMPIGATVSQPDQTATLLSIPTSDGLKLSGSLYYPATESPGLVVFLPELNSDHWTAVTYARALMSAGFAVLSFDFRGQGNSDSQDGYEPSHWITEFELTDIESVLAFIRDDPKLSQLPLGMMGVSRGGSAAMLAVCRYPQVAAVVTDSGFTTMEMIHSFLNKFSRVIIPDWIFSRLPNWHVNKTLRTSLTRSEKARACRYVLLKSELATHTQQPVLLISGDRDSYVTPAVTRTIAAALGQEDNVWIVNKAKHNRSRAKCPDEYDQRIVEHFSNAFAEAASADNHHDGDGWATQPAKRDHRHVADATQVTFPSTSG